MWQWLQTLLILSAAGAVLGLGLMALRQLLKKRLPSAFYYYAWLLVLLRMALPLPGLIETSGAEPEPAEATETAIVGTMDGTYTARPATAALYTGTGTAAEATAAQASAKTGAESAAPAAEPARFQARLEDGWKQPGLWLALWGLGAAVYLLRYLGAYRRFCRGLRKTLLPPRVGEELVYRRLHGQDKPLLCRSGAVTTPMLLGLRKPLLVLPDRAWPEETLEQVLRHELTHYERRDIAFKWFGMAVFALHWFNPLAGLFRRELDRVCELSCDERMLRGMSTEEKQSYGEMLLGLAAERALPRGVVATTFATEKRTLKERLEQIMTYKRIRKTGMALALCLCLLLTGCALALGPRAAEEETAEAPAVQALSLAAHTEASSEPAPTTVENTVIPMERTPVGGEVTVTNVEELLAALASDTTVHLAPGEYNLSEAENYGALLEGGWYSWEEVYDGYELRLLDIENLRLCGPEEGEAVLCTAPRYADVLGFVGGADIGLTGLTIGHTVEPGTCAGGVVYSEGVAKLAVTDCRLYGCGILALEAVNSYGIVVSDSDLYECSNGAVRLSGCYDVSIRASRVYDCGPATALFDVYNSQSVFVVNCEIFGNQVESLIDNNYSQDVRFLGNDVHDNEGGAVYRTATTGTVTVEGCSFRENDGALLENLLAVSPEGLSLDRAALEAMERAEAPYPTAAPLEAAELEKSLNAEGLWEVHVSTVDEFLAAIGPNTIVYLEEGDYILSQAAAETQFVSGYFYWEGYNAPALVIEGVENFHIAGAGAEVTDLLTEPRNATVLKFRDCENISITGLNLGHTEATGPCGAGVLRFEDSHDLRVEDCGLFGCGILGLELYVCHDVAVMGTEVYDCSIGAVRIYDSWDVSFNGCSVRDIGGTQFGIFSSEMVTWDGALLEDGNFDL